MNNQKEKSCLSQFGEFRVASELNRRCIRASVTYGNQKKTDIIALSDKGHYSVIEVKTTQKKRFATGLTPEKQKQIDSNVFWVFISTKLKTDTPDTRFFVLSDKEIKELQALSDEEYQQSYFKKHGKRFTNKGVPSIKLDKFFPFENRWDIIEQYLR